MAAITPLKVTITDDTPSRVAHEVRKQWNAFVAAVAALDSSTATTSQIVTAMQLAKQVATTLELPEPPAPSAL